MIDKLPIELIYIIINFIGSNNIRDIVMLLSSCKYLYSVYLDEIGNGMINTFDIICPTIFSNIKMIRKQHINILFNSFEIKGSPVSTFEYNLYGLEVINHFVINEFIGYKWYDKLEGSFDISINNFKIDCNKMITVKYYNGLSVHYDKHINTSFKKILKKCHHFENTEAVVINFNENVSLFDGDSNSNYIAFFYKNVLKGKEFSLVPTHLYVSHTITL